MYIINHSRRTKAVLLFFLVFLIFSSARFFYIQFFRSDYLATIANKQHNFYIELEPLRGTIYDTNLRPLAVNLSCDSLYGSPNEIPQRYKEEIISQLQPLLNQRFDFLRERLSRNKSFIWLSRKMSYEQSEAIKKLNLKGVGFIKESRRSYPNDYLASQTIGFAGLDNSGLEGLELYYDRELRGEPGWAFILRDGRSKKLDIHQKLLLSKDGYDLVLTIDEVIQYIAEREIDKVFKRYRAKGASIVVMNPYTGEILGLANRPSLNLNQYSKATKEEIRNRAICDLFEPGSVFKIVTAAAALEEDKVSEEDRFFCEYGSYKVANHILNDHRPHGWLSFREIIEQSSNIGVCKVAQILGPAIIFRYIRLFGFGKKTDIGLPGEIAGRVRDARLWSKTSISAIPMGHEVGVTALQLVNAISVVANGGYLMKPYIVKEIRDKQGQVIKVFSPKVAHKVLSKETTDRLKKILIGVIEEGTGKLAKNPNLIACGKTGTAQKLEPNRTYSHSKFIASFIGFAPAEEPFIAVVVIVDEPQGNYFGGVVAAPVFKNVADDVVRYLRTKQTINEVFCFLNEVKTVN